MANYPLSLDTLTNPTQSDARNSPSHAAQHTTGNDIALAIEKKLGIGASTPSAKGKILRTGSTANATSYRSHQHWGVGVRQGGYYVPIGPGQLTGTMAMTSGWLYLVPLWVSYPCSIDRLVLFSNSTTSATVRLGIYTPDSNLRPANLLVDAGTVTFDTVAWKEATVSLSLDIGLYWAGAAYQTGASASTLLIPTAWQSGPGFQGLASLSLTTVLSYVETGVTGAFPSTIAPTSTTTVGPKLQIRYT